jgi:glycosyltransferase involved in cell wall biosynthesis
MNNHKVSIIVPCYNQAQYLDEALMSVLKQTYENWECIIVNDGSPDSTEEVANVWIKKDTRFKYVFQKNGGLSSARNLGLDNSLGDYIQFLDSDDVLDSKKLELSLNEIAHNSSDESIIISNFRMFVDNIDMSSNSYCKLSTELFTFKKVLFDWDLIFNIPIHCGLFQSSFFLNFRFPEELKAKEDWYMWLRFFKKTSNIYFIDLPLAYYRSNPKGLTRESIFMLENYIKALSYVEKLLSEKEYISYLKHLVYSKSIKIIELENKINKYQKSTGFLILQKAKKNKVILFFLKIIKRIKL